MTALHFDEARALAIAALQAMAEESELYELVILDEFTLETPDAWYFPYDSEAYVTDGQLTAALAGNVPIRVAKDGSGLSFEAP